MPVLGMRTRFHRCAHRSARARVYRYLYLFTRRTSRTKAMALGAMGSRRKRFETWLDLGERGCNLRLQMLRLQREEDVHSHRHLGSCSLERARPPTTSCCAGLSWFLFTMIHGIVCFGVALIHRQQPMELLAFFERPRSNFLARQDLH